MSKRTNESDEEDLDLKKKRHAISADDYASDSGESDTKSQHALDLNEIEGQEQDTAEASGSDAITAFNLNEELEEGEFTADGAYVRNKRDEYDVHDSWLEGNESKDVVDRANAQQRAAAERESQVQTRIATENEHVLPPTADRFDCLKALLPHLKTSESPAEAIARFGRSKRNEQDAEAKLKFTSHIDALTVITSRLMEEFDDMDIYSEKHDDIVQTLRDERAVPRSWAPPSYQDGPLEEHETASRQHRKPLIRRQ